MLGIMFMAVGWIWKILPFIGGAFLVWLLMKLFAEMIADEIKRR
jgi:threonine/homoserine/homoserine lactone efflux protein